MQQKDGPAWTVEEYMIQNNRWKEVVRAFLLSFEDHCRELEEIPKKLLTRFSAAGCLLIMKSTVT